MNRKFFSKSIKLLCASVATLAAAQCLALIPVKAVLADAAPMYESHVDHYRTGANLHESLLTTKNVNTSSFGLLFNLPIDSAIMTQTLYLPNLPIQGYIHNVLVVTTTGGTVYLYDADVSGSPLAVVNLAHGGAKYAIPETPIYDPNSGNLYVVTQKITSIPPYEYDLHAINLLSLTPLPGSPVQVSAQASDQSGNKVNLLSQGLIPRAGLALSNGNVIIAFAAYDEENLPYNGWVLSYNATTLKQTGVFATEITPPATGAGIWQSGRAPAVDDNGNIYLFTGNGFLEGNLEQSANDANGVSNFSESLLKFNSNLNLLDWYTASNWPLLDQYDMDLSSSGPLLIPGTPLIVGGGKDGLMRIWNSSSLGHYTSGDSQLLQKMPPPNSGNYFGPQFGIFCGPVFWQRPYNQGSSYLYTAYSTAQVYQFGIAANGYTLNPNALSSTSSTYATNSDYHSSIALSANGGLSGTGILWLFQNNVVTKQSVLHAFNAENLSQELWNSTQYATDNVIGSNTYIPPTISNGKVYAPTSGSLMVYGLTNHNTLPSLIAIGTQTLKRGQTVSVAIGPSTDKDGDPLTYSATSLPPGLTINSKTGVVSGTPTVAGTYRITLTVTDNISGQRSATFDCIVS